MLPFKWDLFSRTFAEYYYFLRILLEEIWIFRKIFTLIGFALTFSTVEHADTAFTAVMDLVPSKDWVTLRLDPNTRHRIIKNLVLFKQTKA